MAALTSENNVQTSLIADINEAGGYAFKMSNMYTTGVPDLSITPRIRGFKFPMHIKMEVKFKKVNAGTKGVTVHLSQPQYGHLMRTTRAGGLGCWVAAYSFTDEQRWGLFVLHASLGSSFKMTKDMLDDPSMQGHFIKPRGKPWPVRDICNLVIDAWMDGAMHLYANWEG